MNSLPDCPFEGDWPYVIALFELFNYFLKALEALIIEDILFLELHGKDQLNAGIEVA